MFKLNLGDTENDITDDEFNQLAQLTEGYSGSDIATLTQDAIYEPLRKCQAARFFKHIDPDHIVPCPPSDEGSFKMTMNEIEHPGYGYQHISGYQRKQHEIAQGLA